MNSLFFLRETIVIDVIVGTAIGAIISGIVTLISAWITKRGKIEQTLEGVQRNETDREKEHDQILQGQKDLSQKLASIREDQIRVQDKQDFMKEQLPTAFSLQKDVQNILNTLAEKEVQLDKIREELQQSKSQVSRLEKELKAEKEKKWKLSNELHEIKYEVKMPKGFHLDHKDSYDTVDH